jgi:osmotically-inducible protein OsmY
MNAHRHDDSIREEIEIGLKCMHGIDPGEVSVAVEAGHVTLTGHVAQHSAREAAEHFASRVAGVRSVSNELQIHRHASQTENEASLILAVREAFGRKRHDHE